MPRDPSVSPTSLFSTRNTSRLKARVTNASHGPCTRSAGKPISTLKAMQVRPATAMARRKGRSGNVASKPATAMSLPVSRSTETYAPMPRKPAWAREIFPAKPWVRLRPMQTMANTTNSPRSTRVAFVRPSGNTTRKAMQPASETHLTTSPFHESTRTTRLRPSTPASAAPQTHTVAPSWARIAGSRTTNVVAARTASAMGHDRRPRSSSGMASARWTSSSAVEVAALTAAAPRRCRTGPGVATESPG